MKNKDIRKIMKQGTQKIVSIPREMNLEVGTFVKVIPVEIQEKAEVPKTA